MKFNPVLLMTMFLLLVQSQSLRADEAAELKELMEVAAEQALEVKQTKAGRMLADRLLAKKMIEYGERENNPESIITGVQILVRNPTTPARTLTQNERDAHNADLVALEELIGIAVDMRPEDEGLLAMAERVAGELDESTRGLAGGPKKWVVEIKKGKYFRLDPTLTYNAQEQAIITATIDTKKYPKVMLGANVRRVDQAKVIKKAAGRGKVAIDWNAGVKTSGWDCRIYNLNGPAVLKVTVVTN